MLAVGERVAQGADEIEQTPYDYPMRNVYQVSKSDGVFVLTGGDGALEEALPALIDYGLPVGIIDGAGKAARAVRRTPRGISRVGEASYVFLSVYTAVDSYCDKSPGNRGSEDGLINLSLDDTLLEQSGSVAYH